VRKTDDNMLKSLHSLYELTREEIKTSESAQQDTVGVLLPVMASKAVLVWYSEEVRNGRHDRCRDRLACRLTCRGVV
jgi:hypothetical protein